jgi:hypothetical protein
VHFTRVQLLVALIKDYIKGTLKVGSLVPYLAVWVLPYGRELPPSWLPTEVLYWKRIICSQLLSAVVTLHEPAGGLVPHDGDGSRLQRSQPPRIGLHNRHPVVAGPCKEQRLQAKRWTRTDGDAMVSYTRIMESTWLLHWRERRCISSSWNEHESFALTTTNVVIEIQIIKRNTNNKHGWHQKSYLALSLFCASLHIHSFDHLPSSVPSRTLQLHGFLC